MSEFKSRNCRVAICDDVASFRQLVSAVFRWEPGFEVVGEAADGVQAIELARRFQPDVILLDIAMPIMDGIEALPKIHEVAPATRVIMITGFGSTSIRSRAMDAGAAAYLEKGATPAEMIAAVRTVFK